MHYPLNRVNRVNRAKNANISMQVLLSILLVVAGLLLAMQPASAATYAVTTTDDELDGDYATDCTAGSEDDCSLREAISTANDNSGEDTITVPAGTYLLDVTGDSENSNATGDLDVTESLTIQGEGAGSTIIDGNSTDRVFHMHGDSNTHSFTVEDLTVQNGDIAGSGGGLFVFNASELTVSNAVIQNSEAGFGGGIDATVESVLIENSLISGNTADNSGGGIYIRADGGARQAIVNSFIVNNTAATRGAGILNTDVIEIYYSTITGNSITADNGDKYGVGIDAFGSVDIYLFGSVLSNNTDGLGDGYDCYGAIGVNQVESLGYNVVESCTEGFNEHDEDVVDTDPLLDTSGLEDNGGTFNTIGLQSSSDAIDLVPAANCLDDQASPVTEDARGMTRPENTDCDAGAYELDQTAPSVSINSNDDDTNTVECSVDIWTDPGATAFDTFDTTVSTASVISGTVDVTTPASYTITYQSEADYDGNQSTLQRTVTVEDTVKPSISTDLSGTTVEVDQGASDSTLEAAVPTVEANDTCDSTLNTSNNVTEAVDSSEPGDYTVTITVADGSGNQDTETFTVTVLDAAGGEEEGGDGSDEEGGEGSDGSEEDGEEEPEESEEPENDPETGEGDGSDDTEEDLGAVVSLTRSTDSMVTVEYENGDTKTFQLFSASAKAKVQLHTNGAILIAINKRYMRTFNAFTGEQLDQVKLFKAAQYKTKFKRFNIYKKAPGKNNVMVLAQTKKKHKKQFKLRSFVVKNGGAITKRPYRTIRLNKNAKFSKLSIAKNKKNGTKARIVIKKKGKTLKNWKYRVTRKKGILKKAS